MLSAERAYALTKFVCADKERAKKLLTMNPKVAAQQINAHGFDYTADEIRDYGRAIRPHLGGHACVYVDALDETTGGVGTMLDVVELDMSCYKSQYNHST